MSYSLDAHQDFRNGFQDRLEKDTFDLVVIGGGITGAGVARDAALRGLKTALLEKDDFASGTSSRSTRMVHGGLRYMAQFRFGLVRESLIERLILYHIAPHLVRPQRFVYPFMEGVTRAMYVYTGLIFYDILAFPHSMGSRKIVGASDLSDMIPVFRDVEKHGAFLYSDCTVNDARLTLSTILSGVASGLVAINHAPVLELIKKDGKIAGCQAMDGISGRSFQVHSRAVLAAVGPWTDAMVRMDGEMEPNLLRPTKGAHILVNRDRFPLDQPVVMYSSSDSRALILVPWQNYTAIGTTDTDFSGDPDGVHITRDEADYLLETVNEHLPHLKLTVNDVQSSWAGVRPMINQPEVGETRNSREHRIVQSPSGLFFLFGGKLTTHRSMAQEAVDMVSKHLGRTDSHCRTAWTPLDGVNNGQFGSFLSGLEDLGQRDYGIGWDTVDHLARTYGGRSRTAFGYVGADESGRQPIHPGSPVLWGELDYSVHHEGTARLTDFMVRRSHLTFQMNSSDDPLAEKIARRMAEMLGWDAKRLDHEMELYSQDRSRREVAA